MRAMRRPAAVEEFLARWARAGETRDAEGYADLFLRDPHPLVTFSDGSRADDWLDVRVRVGRDFERSIVDRVETHDVVSRDLGETTLVAFEYDMHVRDMWGTRSVATRRATFTLVETKDGYRIAAAHFSVPR